MRSNRTWFILAFAGAYGLGSTYGFLRARPFGVVEAVWSLVAVGCWWFAASSKAQRAGRDVCERRSLAGHSSLEYVSPRVLGIYAVVRRALRRSRPPAPTTDGARDRSGRLETRCQLTPNPLAAPPESCSLSRMANDRIAVPYNHKLKRLEALLTGVKRAGEFFVQGSLDAPIPRVEIDGLGVLSFPVPASQIQSIIKRAHRAPYGRGEHTIVDTSVRNAWQLDSADMRIGGKAWEKTFHQIMSTVIAGLGCSGMKVSATLYKLLVYETGGLFRPHRDTEKADGMFGTPVVVLPSSHGGGELIIRHGTREVSVNLSSPDVSQLTFAAFYADCEHEVKPITHGSRVCLTYNLSLVEKGTKTQGVALTAPLYEREVSTAVKILGATFRKGGAPTKLAWLLEHQYSAVGLSFMALKGQDAARVQVLSQAAERAGCAAHLGVVHVEETGPAEPHFDTYGYGGWRPGWRDDDASDEEEDLDEEREAAVRDDFDVIEVSDAWHYVDHWVDGQNRSIDFGKLPLKENELLPAGALDDAAPDEQRLTEATGNEGASFERCYRRGALVMWPRNRSADVLLQGGVRAVMPYLKDIAQRCSLSSASRAERAAARSIAGRIRRQRKRGAGRQRGIARRQKGGRVVLQLGARSRAVAAWRMCGSAFAPRPRARSSTRLGVAERIAEHCLGDHRGTPKTAETYRCV
jgi:hypothetical protein